MRFGRDRLILPTITVDECRIIVKTVRIATRKSLLALWQANYVKQQLEYHHSDVSVELVTLTSQGDRLLDTPLTKIGGKGLFVKELEKALADKKADIAVHSMKDVPMRLPEGLYIGAICPREDPSDAFVSARFETLDDLPQGARVGTSSLRRKCQILAYRSDLRIHFLRGNVNTRLAKLDQGEFDAIILASAGLIRLEMPERIRSSIPIAVSLPAVGQGAVGIELRRDDEAMQKLIDPLHDSITAVAVGAERAMNKRLNGSCQVPIGGYAELEDDQVTLKGLVGQPDGSVIIRAQSTNSTDNWQAVGVSVAESLLSQGADSILSVLAHEE
ncbi:Porphobilinogen deaminase [invertebrate metagenome]|uniref:Porphobilinogen deaminase n=1 Tax=invertebrate metagenome TaxID=1711999 RepID=A0A2H9TBX3_9ZZZZ